MQFKSLESRIVTLFLLLIVSLQLISLGVMSLGIRSNARSAIQNELLVGERIFQQLVEQRGEKLAEAARLLASDYGFRQAIASGEPGDHETVASVLQNHGERIKAAFALFVDKDRKIVSGTIAMGNNLTPLVAPLLDSAEQKGGVVTITQVRDKLYQIVVVPIKAPDLFGWVVMAFPLDHGMTAEMKRLSGIDIAILSHINPALGSSASPWLIQGNTIDISNELPRLKKLSAKPAPLDPPLQIKGEEYGAVSSHIGNDSEHRVLLMLPTSKVLVPYSRLQMLLLGLSLAGLAVAVAVSLWTAKRIAQPLSQLAEVAKRLGRGEYSAQIECKRRDEIGALADALGNMRDDIAKREFKISRLAYWDTLTNLANRVQFTRLLAEAMSAATEKRGSCCVLMMDLDRFKYVNDVLGHSVGDALLKQLGQRLLDLLSTTPGAVVARFGGDEFAILLPHANLQQARELGQQVLAALERPLTVEDQTVDVGAGLGVAVFPDHGDQADGLLGLAEVAMYYAKQHNSGVVVYDAKIDTSSKQNLSLLTELRHASEHNEFRLFAQPKIDLASGKVVGLEALVRWQHPAKGMVFPDNFIPFAEQTGFIRILTRWVMQQSAALAQQLRAQGLNLKISVNLSTRDLLDQDLPQKFMDILQSHQVEPAMFCLEITESAIMDDPVRAQTTLERLHVLGFDLSIDDFGTGYSSLAYLKRLPVNELKIDKSFVLNMAQDQGDTKIVRSTIDLGHNMGLRVVAEGLENEAVWHLLAQLGCDQAQGYFMSRPLPVAQIPAWIASWQAPTLSAEDFFRQQAGK